MNGAGHLSLSRPDDAEIAPRGCLTATANAQSGGLRAGCDRPLPRACNAGTASVRVGDAHAGNAETPSAGARPLPASEPRYPRQWCPIIPAGLFPKEALIGDSPALTALTALTADASHRMAETARIRTGPLSS